MSAAGRRAMQEKAGYRADPPPEPASQLCDAWQTFSVLARLPMRSISLPTGKKPGKSAWKPFNSRRIQLGLGAM